MLQHKTKQQNQTKLSWEIKPLHRLFSFFQQEICFLAWYSQAMIRKFSLARADHKWSQPTLGAFVQNITLQMFPVAKSTRPIYMEWFDKQFKIQEAHLY